MVITLIDFTLAAIDGYFTFAYIVYICAMLAIVCVILSDALVDIKEWWYE